MFKRKIFYLGGFDPRGGRFYHALLAEQVARAPALSLSEPRRAGKDMAWTVAGDGVEAQFHFLAWDDLVRRHWVKAPPALLAATVRAYWGFVTQAQWHRTAKVPGGSKFTLFYPGATLIGVPLLLAMLVGGLLRWLVPGWLALAGALVAGFGLGWWLLVRIHSLWLLRFIIFNDRFARRATGPALDERLAQFAATITTALDEDWDEVLLVTHSNGSILAVPVLAQVLAARGGELPGNFAFVSLGGCVQLLEFRRDAPQFRAQLATLARGRLAWLDVGSLTDGAAIPLVDPWLGHAPCPPHDLTQLSPRWFRYCDPATYKARRADKYATHFDYLRRLDRASPLDYLGLTCAARALAVSIAAFEADNA